MALELKNITCDSRLGSEPNGTCVLNKVSRIASAIAAGSNQEQREF